MATERVDIASAPAEAQWYVIHAYSGHEDKVKQNLERRIESMDMQDQILDVLVPMEDEIEIKDGKRRHVQKRIFPGYVLVRMRMSDESWYVVRNTPGVTSFVGSGTKPVPLQEEEVRSILKQMKQEAPNGRGGHEGGGSGRAAAGKRGPPDPQADEAGSAQGARRVRGGRKRPRRGRAVHGLPGQG